MLRNDKIEFIWNYIKNSHSDFRDYETLSNEDNEFLDICLEDIFEYENWDLNQIENYKS